MNCTLKKGRVRVGCTYEITRNVFSVTTSLTLVQHAQVGVLSGGQTFS